MGNTIIGVPIGDIPEKQNIESNDLIVLETPSGVRKTKPKNLKSDVYTKEQADNRFINVSQLDLLNDFRVGLLESSTIFKLNGQTVTPTQDIGYVDNATGKVYIWDGTVYKKVGGGGKASEIENDSYVQGTTVKEALENAGIGKADQTVQSGTRRKFNLTGAVLYFLGLLDKSADATFNRMLAVNSTGDLASTNGKSIWLNMPTLLTSAEKQTWRTQMNDNYSQGTIGIATSTNSPTSWKTGDAYLYERWAVTSAQTLTNFKDSNGTAIVVTTQDLDGNFVYIDVVNGVSSKFLVKSKGDSVNDYLDLIPGIEKKDLISYIEPATSFMRGYFGNEGIAPNKTYTISARNNDYQFTADLSTFSGTSLTGSFAVFDGANYHPIRAIDIDRATGIVKTIDKLPTNCINCQTLFGDGLHLSRHGYKAMAEWLVENSILKNSQRKQKTFSVYAYDQTLSYAQQNFVRSSQTILQMNKLTPTTVSGGWLNQGEGVTGYFALTHPASISNISAKFPNYWMMSQNQVGTGLKFELPTSVNGYVRLVCGLNYKKNVITGKVKVVVKDDRNIELYNNNLEFGLKEIIINITAESKTLYFEASLLSNEITQFTISQIEVFKTYLENEAILKKDGLKIMFLCDSWGCFPNREGVEVSEKRPDNSLLQGLAFLPNHTKTYLQQKGYNVEIYNFSRGSQTSAWGAYWVDEFIKRCPKIPDYCVINFFINDNYSGSNVAGNTPSSAYDFSPTNPYEFKRSDEGGIFGSTNSVMWINNINTIVRRLQIYNIKPIIIGFPQIQTITLSMEQRNIAFLTN